MRPPQAHQLLNAPSGLWQVWVDPVGVGEKVNVSKFRGAATSVDNLSTTDPFGPAAATLTFPAITLLDRPGAGDLWWLIADANVDICWVAAVTEKVLYRWQGYFTSFEYGEEDNGGNLTITCTGALKQMDNYLAKPEYLYQPIAYEYAIYRQFLNRPDLRLSEPAHPSTIFPSWWATKFKMDDYTLKQTYMLPYGPVDGDPWSGMVTRQTGNWEPVLSSYIQGLLSSMYTERGQFTLLLGENRQPILKHRDMKFQADDETLIVDLLWPGVQMSATQDYSQRLNVVYGQGKALSGSSFSNMQVVGDGSRTVYVPFAYRREVYPADTRYLPDQEMGNRWFDASKMRKEVSLSFMQGVDASEAAIIADKHLKRFAEPGVTGQLTLKTDPLMGDEVYPRQMVQAGMSVLVRGLLGRREGILLHITECSISADGVVSATVDSKYRDQITVQEVRQRGRDALVPIRMLSAGNFAPLIPDLLFPWSYEMGSGFFPLESAVMFRESNRGLTDTTAYTAQSDLFLNGYDFPWEGMTIKYPPKYFPQYYAKVDIANTSNPSQNWSTRPGQSTNGSIVRFSAKGDIKLVQVAAFDADGNVKRVPFHMSVYAENNVQIGHMPWITSSAQTAGLVPYAVNGENYNYPFTPGAWETMQDDGTSTLESTSANSGTNKPMIGWGNFYEKAGYWPTSSIRANASPKNSLTQACDIPPTGLLVDESGFSYDFTTASSGSASRVNNQMPADEQPETSVDASVMIYCDQEWDEANQQLVPLRSPVYFVARFYRREPGGE